MDLQALYPAQLLPNFITQLPKLYIELSGDPLIGGAMGFPGFGDRASFTWFISFLNLELCVLFHLTRCAPSLIDLSASSRFQCSFWEHMVCGKVSSLSFYASLSHISSDSRAIYLPLLLYGASTSTTTLPCLAVLFTTPITSPDTIAAGIVSVTWFQKQLLLGSYIPFLLLPFVIAADMTLRVSELVVAGIRAQEAIKKQ